MIDLARIAELADEYTLPAGAKASATGSTLTVAEVHDLLAIAASTLEARDIGRSVVCDEQPFSQARHYMDDLNAAREESERLRADLGRTVTHASRLATRETELRAALLKICEPITVTGDADTITACQDMHEIICEIAQEALSKSGG